MPYVVKYFVIPQFLTRTTTYQVVGGFLSPWHQSTLKNCLRRFPSHAIPAKHRVAMCHAAVESSSWISVSDWESQRKLPLDYPAVLRNMQQVGVSDYFAIRVFLYHHTLPSLLSIAIFVSTASICRCYKANMDPTARM